MRKKLPKPIGYILAVITGILLWIPAFFVIIFGIFADSRAAHMATYIAGALVPITITFFILGAMFSFICNFIWSKASSWRWGIWISIPAFVSVVRFGRGLRLELLYTIAVVPLVFACLGAHAGMQIALLIKSWTS